MICFFRCGNDNVVRHAYSPATPVEDYKLLLTLTLILSLTLSPVGVARCRCGATGSGSPTRECAAPRARRPCLGRPRRPSRHPHREAEQAEAATEGVGSEQSHCHRYSSWCVVGGPRHYRENSHLGECARLMVIRPFPRGKILLKCVETAESRVARCRVSCAARPGLTHRDPLARRLALYRKSVSCRALCVCCCCKCVLPRHRDAIAERCSLASPG